MITTRSFRLVLLLALGFIACSPNLESDLRKASADPNAVMIVKDRGGEYVAFSAGRIAKIEGNKVTLKAGTLVTKGSGTASKDAIASELRNMRSKANPGGFGATKSTITGTSGSITIENESLEKDTVIDVVEILSLTGPPKDDSVARNNPDAGATETAAASETTEGPIEGGVKGGVVGGVPGGVPVDVQANAEAKPVTGPPKTISGGVLNNNAVSLPQPAYPPSARAVKAAGPVSVQVTVDQSGNVVSASAVSGHPLLRAAAVEAARGARFKPTLLSGQPVKVSGVITYNFVLQ